MTTKSLWIKYKPTIFGLLGSLFFGVSCVLLYLMDKGELIPFFLYVPGAIFGLAMAAALDDYSKDFGVIFIFSTAEYLAMILLTSVNFEYFLEARRLLMGGIGAVLFLYTVRLTTSIKLGFSDHIIGFATGIGTTIFMWTDNFKSFNLWLIILSIVLWQIFIAVIINRRQLKLEA